MFSFDKITGEIWLYDAIGPSEFWGMETGMIDAKSIGVALQEIGDKRVTLRINSPGGFVDEGIAIYNALERHAAGVDVAIDSLAASMGSYLAMVGETITIAKNGAMMVHGPQGGVAGGLAEIRHYADILEKYGERTISTYAARSKKSEDEIRELFQGEYWYTAQEAVANGFADKIGNVVVEARQQIVPKGMFSKTPAAFLTEQPRERACAMRSQAAARLKLLKSR